MRISPFFGSRTRVARWSSGLLGNLNFPSRSKRWSLAICALILTSVFSLLAQTKPTGEPTKPDFAQVQKYIQKQMAAESTPSVTIAVGRRGEIVWEGGFGWADKERGIKAGANTPYLLASVTKSITGTALMVLQEQGKLDLDRPVNQYLGTAKVHSPMWDASQATVRRMATHTAGLTTYARDCALDERDCRVSIDTAIERYGILFWPPGDHFDYSNLGYGILGDVIARASGKSYGDFLRDEIFQPLGMSDCGLRLTPKQQERAAAQYDQTTHRRSPARNSDHEAASSVRCSVHDLARFGMFTLNQHVSGQKAILSETSRNAMLNITIDAGDGQSYGLGWWADPNLNGYRVSYGAGGTTDEAAALYMLPSEGIVIAVLANTGTIVTSKIVEETLSAMLSRFREERYRKAESAKPHTETAPEKPHPTALSGTWTGEIQTWKGAVPLTLVISAAGAQARVGSQSDHTFESASVEDRSLYGVVQGDIGTPDAPRPPYNLEFNLYQREDALVGAVTTRTLPNQDGAALSYWVTVKRTP